MAPVRTRKRITILHRLATSEFVVQVFLVALRFYPVGYNSTSVAYSPVIRRWCSRSI